MIYLTTTIILSIYKYSLVFHTKKSFKPPQQKHRLLMANNRSHWRFKIHFIGQIFPHLTASMLVLTYIIFFFQISGFLTVDKAKRLTAKEALNHPFFQREVSLWIEHDTKIT